MSLRTILGLLLLCLPAFAAPVELTFATFNIRYRNTSDTGWKNWSARRAQVVATIKAMNPDILGVQEALHSQMEELRTALSDYEITGSGRDDGATKGEYSAIFHRKSVLTRTSDHGMLWLSDTPTVPGSTTWGNTIPRVATWAGFTHAPTGRTLTVVCTHWDHLHQGSREKSAALLLSRFSAKQPLVLLGDFNANTTNPAVRLILDHRNPVFTHTILARHPGRPQGTFNGWTTSSVPDAMIDHILASAPCEVSDSRIITPAAGAHPPSDHFPVTATVRFP